MSQSYGLWIGENQLYGALVGENFESQSYVLAKITGMQFRGWRSTEELKKRPHVFGNSQFFELETIWKK